MGYVSFGVMYLKEGSNLLKPYAILPSCLVPIVSLAFNIRTKGAFVLNISFYFNI